METEKDDRIECKIEDMGAYGEGVTHIGEQTVFIPGAIVGEKVRARVVMVKKGIAHAVTEKVISPSPYRVVPPCPYFKQCGGCTLQHIAYPEQLRIKKAAVAVALKKYAAVDLPIEDVVPSDSEFYYRNKISLPVRKVGGDTVCGLFMKKSHRVVRTENCLLQKPITFRAAKDGFDFALSCGLSGYDEIGGKGDLRHITVRSLSGEIALTFVLNGENPKFERSLRLAAEKSGRENLSVFVNVNTARNNVILSPDTRLVYGGSTAKVCGMETDTHPGAFFQVNDNVRDKLYAAALKQTEGFDAVLDAYSGAGVMSAMFAGTGKRVIGAEISAEAVASANRLKERMNFDNLSFLCGDCKDEVGRAAEELKKYGRVCAVLDPPKSGCCQSVLDAVSACGQIEKIVYISCNPATLARDTARLKENGFEVGTVRPFDMFPQTSAVETLLALERTEK